MGRVVWVGAAGVWLATLGLPVGLMLTNLRVPQAWIQGLTTFAEQWGDSLQVALAAGITSVLLALCTVGLWQASERRVFRWAALLAESVEVFQLVRPRGFQHLASLAQLIEAEAQRRTT